MKITPKSWQPISARRRFQQGQRSFPRTLVVIIAVFVTSAVVWNLIIPPYENLDELEHAEVVRHVATSGRLPIAGETDNLGYSTHQEALQPPLYYMLAALWSRLLDLPLAPHNPEPIPSHLVACGPSTTLYNKATWRHDPYTVAFSWSGVELTVHALRLFSTLLQVFTLWGTWTLAQRLFPGSPVPAMATVIVAFNPQFLLIASGVNNDNVTIPLATWGLILAYDLGRKGPNPWRALLMGAVVGLTSLSKLSGFGLLGLAGLALLVYAWREKMSLLRLVTSGVMMLVPAVLLLAPWIARNIRLYNDPTALAPMLDIVGRRSGLISPGEARLMFLSYWGQLPCSFYPRGLYWPYIVLVAGGILGVCFIWRKLTNVQKAGLALCMLWIVIIVIAWLRWDTLTAATGGRLLFPTIAAVAILLACGWQEILKHRARWWTAILPVWAMVTLVTGPVTMFAPPPTLPMTASLPNPTEATFGETITLRGYTMQIRRPVFACIFNSRTHCTPTLDLTLYWEAERLPEEEWVQFIQLVSPAPGDTTLRLNYNHWPGRGNLPVTTWPTDSLIRDRYILPIDTTQATGAATLLIGFVDESGSRVSVRTSDAGVPQDALALATQRVPGQHIQAPEWHNPITPVTFGEGIVLEDAQVQGTQGDIWQVDLVWRCKDPPQADYTVFVHAYDESGQLLSTGDAPPQYGAFPTRLWEQGDRILDSHTLTVGKFDVLPATIAVGLYNPLTGERLPAEREGAALPNHAGLIWEAKRGAD